MDARCTKQAGFVTGGLLSGLWVEIEEDHGYGFLLSLGRDPTHLAPSTRWSGRLRGALPNCLAE
eukprot:650748-Amphidinium_carterae.1